MTQPLVARADGPLTFKRATTAAEIEQIHRLNYRTFVDEIPQHPPNGDLRLVDKFDRDNTYIVCRRGDRVVGMLAIRERRPFSLDTKLPDVDRYLPPHRAACEVRLLAVEPEHRTGVVFRGLMEAMNEYTGSVGFDLGVISAAVRQLKLYRHMGFVAFGPIVGTEDAPYQPMYITRENFETTTGPAIRTGTDSPAARTERSECFLPGPVVVHSMVWTAFTRPPVSHRHPDFAHDLRTTQRALRTLTGANHVQLLVGSGTLANDTVAAQLSLLETPGLVLANGEFGERLVDHARRASLAHDVVRANWGAVYDLAAVEESLDALPPGGWCWMVHCETSSGILNDLGAVQRMCRARSIHLCVDGVSSIGTVPVDLRDVYLASCVSGKAIASMSGLSMVFYRDDIAPSGRLPRYLDLGYAAVCGGVPFTQSSNLLAALSVAVERTVRRSPFADVATLGAWLRGQLRGRGFSVVAPEASAAPAIVTLAIPGAGEGSRFGDRLAAAGYELNYRSDYLRKRDWVQVALMGEFSRARVEPLLDAMERLRSE